MIIDEEKLLLDPDQKERSEMMALGRNDLGSRRVSADDVTGGPIDQSSRTLSAAVHALGVPRPILPHADPVNGSKGFGGPIRAVAARIQILL